MVSIEWCLHQRNGLEMVEPNENTSSSYLKMAEESISMLGRVEGSRIWTATMTYYIFYYSLYAMMLRIGIKCEIHLCSIQFMKSFLMAFYDPQDIDMLEKSFKARIDLQYYADRAVEEKILQKTRRYCKDFYIKTKDTVSRISEAKINEVREALAKHRP